jgi:hypothetical protein
MSPIYAGIGSEHSKREPRTVRGVPRRSATRCLERLTARAPEGVAVATGASREVTAHE